jgi:hypothetical protein
MSSSSPSSYSHYLPRTSGSESVMSSAYDAYRNRTLDEANNYLSIDISTDTRPGNHQHHHHRALEKTTMPSSSSSVSWYDRSKYSQNNRYAYDIHDNDNFYIRKFGDFYMTSGGGGGSESINRTQTAAVSCEQKPSSSLVAQQQQQELNASYENNKVGLILLFYFFFSISYHSMFLIYSFPSPWPPIYSRTLFSYRRCRLFSFREI